MQNIFVQSISPLSLIKLNGAFFARLCPNGTGANLINSLDTSRSRKRSRRTNQRCPAEISKAFRTRLLSSCSLHPTQSREGPLICYHRYLRHQRLLCLRAAIVKMHLHMKLCIHFLSATRCKFMQIQYRHRLFLSDLARGRCLRPEQSSSPNFSMGHHSLNLCTHHASSMSLYYLPAKHTHILPENRCCMLQSVDSRLYLPIESKSQGTNCRVGASKLFYALFFFEFFRGTCSSRSPLLSSSLQLSILQNVACVDFVDVFIFRSKRIKRILLILQFYRYLSIYVPFVIYFVQSTVQMVEIYRILLGSW